MIRFLHSEAIYDKIVNRGRGGWCHELNGIFAWLLRAIGFQVTLVAARSWQVSRGDWNSGSHDHMVLVVNLEGKMWYAGVGSGFSKVINTGQRWSYLFWIYLTISVTYVRTTTYSLHTLTVPKESANSN